MPLPIGTERLTIRPLNASDIEAMNAVFSDPVVIRFIPGGACDMAGSRERVQTLIDHHCEHGVSKWAVTLTSTGEVLGDCGLQYLDGGPDLELGFHLARTQSGRGYASEAADACLRWALTERTERVVAIVDPLNGSSRRVLERIGMRPTGVAHHFGRDWTFYEVARDEGVLPLRELPLVRNPAATTDGSASIGRRHTRSRNHSHSR